jgi:Arc/MetJ family transcription regulator
MGTNFHIDESLLKEAQKLGGKKSKRETVTEALEEYVQRRKQVGLLKLFGTIEFHPDYDHKAARKQR